MKKGRVIALGTILACSIGLGTLSVEAGNENSGYSFEIKKEQGNEYTGTKYRQTTTERNTWKVRMYYSKEGTNTYTTYWLEKSNGTNGKDISFPSNISVIIENTSLLHQYDAYTNLKILSKIRNIATDEDIKLAIKRVGLDPDSKMKVGKFSLGMKQRLSVAQAIFEKPDILLLDEPTNAIDEEGVIQVYQILKEEKERGSLIILTSHHKQDLEALADEYIKMDNGGIVLDSK
ncbi:ATP-binding cassette domain-containing protein [Peribacillus simplex]|uniref:ATP-binding cassette domain-containing protein n=1 Tax=Peribacillus simplex TaxID=1478 RepID=UPI003D2A6634